VFLIASNAPDVSGVSSQAPTSIKKPIFTAPGYYNDSVSTENPLASVVRLY